jgi:hypothetical protein
MASLKKQIFVVLIPNIGQKASSAVVLQPQPQENIDDKLMKEVKR